MVICVQGWFGTGEGKGCSRPPDDATLPTVGCFDSRNCTESAGLPSRRKEIFLDQSDNSSGMRQDPLVMNLIHV